MLIIVLIWLQLTFEYQYTQYVDTDYDVDYYNAAADAGCDGDLDDFSVDEDGEYYAVSSFQSRQWTRSNDEFKVRESKFFIS